MSNKRERRELFICLGVDKRLDEYPELAKWANAYVKAAAAAGEDVKLEDFNDGDKSTLAGTIRLICDLWPYCEWSEWLNWQIYGGPHSRGPWWCILFDRPERWSGGIMILSDPSRFAFSTVLMESEQPFAQFEIRSPRKAQLAAAEIKWLAHSVLSGVSYDYDDSEFGLICEKWPEAL